MTTRYGLRFVSEFLKKFVFDRRNLVSFHCILSLMDGCEEEKNAIIFRPGLESISLGRLSRSFVCLSRSPRHSIHVSSKFDLTLGYHLNVKLSRNATKSADYRCYRLTWPPSVNSFSTSRMGCRGDWIFQSQTAFQHQARRVRSSCDFLSVG